jgi:nitrile hydratase accessory protein
MMTTDPAFDAPWQARCFGIAVRLQDMGRIARDEWARRLGAALRSSQGEEDGQAGYYEAWLDALEEAVIDAGIIERGELDAALRDIAEHADDHDHGDH